MKTLKYFFASKEYRLMNEKRPLPNPEQREDELLWGNYEEGAIPSGLPLSRVGKVAYGHQGVLAGHVPVFRKKNWQAILKLEKAK
jgi:hypothetical protein